MYNALHLLRQSLALAALTPSQYRGPYKSWDRGRWEDVFRAQPDHDRNAFRCYIPFKSSTLRQKHTPPELEVGVTRALDAVGASIVDMFRNTALDKYKRPTTIMKILQRQDKDTASKYEQWYSRLAHEKDEELLICFSRHPYDVAGASTDRNWTSCFDLVSGDANAAAFSTSEVKEGAIVAYLIRASDRNVNNPMCRMTLRPYVKAVKTKDAQAFDADEFDIDAFGNLVRSQPLDAEDTSSRQPVIVYPTGTPYGDNVPGFVEACVDWCKRTFKISGSYVAKPSKTGDGPVKLTPKLQDFGFSKYEPRRTYAFVRYWTSRVVGGEVSVSDPRVQQAFIISLADGQKLERYAHALERSGVRLDPNTTRAFMPQAVDYIDRTTEARDELAARLQSFMSQISRRLGPSATKQMCAPFDYTAQQSIRDVYKKLEPLRNRVYGAPTLVLSRQFFAAEPEEFKKLLDFVNKNPPTMNHDYVDLLRTCIEKDAYKRYLFPLTYKGVIDAMAMPKFNKYKAAADRAWKQNVSLRQKYGDLPIPAYIDAVIQNFGK